jgi:lipoprotein signal peptidase
MTHGAVVDFLNVGLGDHLRTGIFNFADVAVFLGICVLIFSMSESSNVIQGDGINVFRGRP